MAEIADADFERFGCERVARDHAQADRADQVPDHGVSLAVLLAWRTLLETRPNCLSLQPSFLLSVLQVTIMRALFAFTLLLLTGWWLTGWASARAADAPKLAVFDFEMIDSSLEGEMHGKRKDEQERLMGVGDQLRKELGESGK